MKRILVPLFLIITFCSNGQKINWNEFNKAVEYQNQGNYSQAILIYTNLLKIDSNIYGCWHNRGQCLYQSGSYKFALCDFYKAINLYQRDSSLFFITGLTHIYLEQWTKGIEFLNYAIEKNYPKNEDYFQNLGTCYFFIEQKDSAIKYLTKSYQINSKSRRTLTNLAFAYQETNPFKSCTFFKQAYELDSLNARTINNLGYSYYLCGNLDTALIYYNKSINIDSTNSYVYRNIGLYYMKKDDKENACKYLSLALGKGFIKDWGQNDIIILMNYCDKNK